jgi:hypothetical protein
MGRQCPGPLPPDVPAAGYSEFGVEHAARLHALEMLWVRSLLGGAVQVKGRIVNVSSISAGSDIDWDNLNQEKGFSSHK